MLTVHRLLIQTLECRFLDKSLFLFLFLNFEKFTINGTERQLALLAMIALYTLLPAPVPTGAPVIAEALAFKGAPVSYWILRIAPDPASAPAPAG